MYEDDLDPDGEYEQMTTAELLEALNELDDHVDGDTPRHVARAVNRTRTYVEHLILSREPAVTSEERVQGLMEVLEAAVAQARAERVGR